MPAQFPDIAAEMLADAIQCAAVAEYFIHRPACCTRAAGKSCACRPICVTVHPSDSVFYVLDRLYDQLGA